MKILFALAVLIGFASALVPYRDVVSLTPANELLAVENEDNLSPLSRRSVKYLDAFEDHSREFWQPRDSSLVESSINPEHLWGHLILIFGHHLIYAFSGKVAKVTIQTVTSQLLKHSLIGEPDKATMDKIERVLTEITFIALSLALVFKKGGMQKATLGADDGKGGKEKVKRQSVSLGSSVDMVSWDVADDDAHTSGNNFTGRPILSDELRTQMIGEGLRNVTFMHASSLNAPILAHAHEDGSFHFHWRQPQGQSLVEPRADQVFKKHYAFFDADGAGFKISSTNPIDPKIPSIPEKDARKIASAIVRDLLKKQSGMSYAGYEEELKESGMIGHRLCFFPEMKRFTLNNEVNKCFTNGK
ncbi:hypothetical protein K461DRAFT_270314 [Myriangium duriaei CBS 260.36]|uniref:Uncharacterized protein n=1 Tax=Myriangium duriaei CBS 260.36 TaxID=1168546 RepID=A0A9P4ITH7_9PEZI|nr:hypothetical protein K461DRAFT_270314 [Myriangium duriaei CBS 260.36]